MASMWSMPGSSPISFIRVTPTSHADWWRACGGERGRRQEEERAEGAERKENGEGRGAERREKERAEVEERN